MNTNTVKKEVNVNDVREGSVFYRDDIYGVTSFTVSATNDKGVLFIVVDYGVEAEASEGMPRYEYKRLTATDLQSKAWFAECYTTEQSITGNSLVQGDTFKVLGATFTIGNISPDGFAMFSIESVRGYRANRQHVDIIAYRLNNMNAVKA